MRHCLLLPFWCLSLVLTLSLAANEVGAAPVEPMAMLDTVR